ncbi:hypothetical protein GCM10009583_09390 [Ornithinicoccus hortensis]
MRSLSHTMRSDSVVKLGSTGTNRAPTGPPSLVAAATLLDPERLRETARLNRAQPLGSGATVPHTTECVP